MGVFSGETVLRFPSEARVLRPSNRVPGFRVPPHLLLSSDELNVPGSGAFIEIQGTAEGTPFSRADMDALVGLADMGIRELVAAQKQALGL